MNQVVDLTTTTDAKSDQLNADDLIGGAIDIKVTAVKLLGGDQPIAISYEGDNGKPYKPGKSMRRVLVHIWGHDGNAYVGRSMRLFRDGDVMFGGVKVGGIRISHMSHLNENAVMALTVTRGSKKPYQVKPLVAASAAATIDVSGLKKAGSETAKGGMDALKAWWKGIGGTAQKAIGGAEYLEELKKIAEKPDQAVAETASAQTTSGADDEVPFDV